MNHKIMLLLLTIVLGVAGPSFAQRARESTHTVRPGETLAVIAARYEVDLNDLAAINGIYNYHRIYSWQELTIPGLSDDEAPIVDEARTHVIRYGETLSGIALRYSVDLTELKILNDLYGKAIYPGHELRLPSPNDSSAAVLNEPPGTSQSRQHIVQYGDTLGTIAAVYGLSLNELILVNGIFNHIIYPGQVLTLPDADGRTLVNAAASAPAAEPSQPITLGSRLSYIVRAGDTLGDLAKHFGITWPAIMRANDITYPYHIYIGQHLWIPSTGSPALNVNNVEPAPVYHAPPETVDAPTIESAVESEEALTEGPPPGDYFQHRVQHGETLGILAIRFGATVQDLIAANNISYPYHIYVGQQLWIPSTGAAALDAADVAPAPVYHEPTETIAAETTESPAETSEPAPALPPPGDYFEHTVQHGETLGILAIRHGLTVQDLLAANDITYPYHIYVGQHLWIPSTSAAGLNVADVEPAPVYHAPTETSDAETTESPAETSAPAAQPSQPIKLGSQLFYTVRAGDTLGDLARHFGITWPAILLANDIVYPYHIYVGQHLWIPSTGSPALNVLDVEPAPVSDPPTETVDAETTESPPETSEPAPDGPPPGDYFEHTIQYGETLGILAIHYGLTVQDLLAANSIDDANRIESGQTLWIPASAKRRDPPPPPQLPEPAQQPQPSEPAQEPATEVASQPLTPGDRDVYIVQPSDSLSMIGKQLATDWVVMAAINGIASPYNLHVGMTLWVPNSDDLIQYDSIYAPATMPDVPDPGARVGVGRELIVILDTQMAYAYENGVLQKKALISSGLPATPTVQGDFKIRRKVRKQTMSGPGYSLDNVEWVMYFYAGYAFHGTWWHTNFGHPQSKGCINMTNADAKWFYDFASLGTPVHVRYY
ncbi:MAG: LysM peptidoglycan-binding domain-containing protein [Chloroflexi bacterium]|nr:LysM peptidoglycan-binding domain-containing protein [Chloroflexota bacterium]